MFNWKVGQRVKVIGDSRNYTESIDGQICTIVKLYDEYAVVQEDHPAKYQWYVYYDNLIPVNKDDLEIDYDWLELGDLNDAI